MKSKIFLGKGKIGEIFHIVCFRKQGGNASLPQGGWTPLVWCLSCFLGNRPGLRPGPFPCQSLRKRILPLANSYSEFRISP